MFGRTSHTGTLELRKQLLIAESELNRAQLSDECRVMREGVRGAAQQARNILLSISAPALLVAGLLLLRQKRNASSGEKSSFLGRALKVAYWAGSIFLALSKVPRQRE